MLEVNQVTSLASQLQDTTITLIRTKADNSLIFLIIFQRK